MAAERRLRRQLRNKHGESSPSEFNFPKHSASTKRTKPGIRKALKTGNLEFPIRMGIS
jgi:hypothetical protein